MQGVETSSTSKTQRTINRGMGNRLVEGGPRDLVTVLLLKSVSGQDDHLGEHDNQEKRGEV